MREWSDPPAARKDSSAAWSHSRLQRGIAPVDRAIHWPQGRILSLNRAILRLRRGTLDRMAPCGDRMPRCSRWMSAFSRRMPRCRRRMPRFARPVPPARAVARDPAVESPDSPAAALGSVPESRAAADPSAPRRPCALGAVSARLRALVHCEGPRRRQGLTLRSTSPADPLTALFGPPGRSPQTPTKRASAASPRRVKGRSSHPPTEGASWRRSCTSPSKP